MIDTLEIIGWLGQAFFFLRFLLQYLQSEQAGRITVPTAFWWMSLAGALCSGAYAFGKDNIVFLAAPAINVFIYSRNLAILRGGRRFGGREAYWLLAGIACLAGLGLVMKDDHQPAPWYWLSLGITGQVLWTARFPLQWLHAERKGQVTLPTSFFAISLIGSVLLLAFAIYLKEPVWIAGQALNPALYSRQLWLSLRPRPQGLDLTRDVPAGAPQ